MKEEGGGKKSDRERHLQSISSLQMSIHLWGHLHTYTDAKNLFINDHSSNSYILRAFIMWKVPELGTVTQLSFLETDLLLVLIHIFPAA